MSTLCSVCGFVVPGLLCLICKRHKCPKCGKWIRKDEKCKCEQEKEKKNAEHQADTV